MNAPARPKTNVIGRYTKKPVTVQAVQLTDDNLAEVIEWADTDAAVTIASGGGVLKLTIHTLEGDVIAKSGDWVIRGVAGEFYPCRDDIFRATYEV